MLRVLARLRFGRSARKRRRIPAGRLQRPSAGAAGHRGKGRFPGHAPRRSFRPVKRKRTGAGRPNGGFH